ncbi:hypothetical protein Lal_00019734 [Lupinus albus]|nr:hypothetical protein Lal_00019734 [Lupinus albus]
MGLRTTCFPSLHESDPNTAPFEPNSRVRVLALTVTIKLLFLTDSENTNRDGLTDTVTPFACDSTFKR